MKQKGLILVVTGLIGISLTGCFSSKAKNIEAYAKPYQMEVTMGSYVLQPPDTIVVTSSKVPELNSQSQIRTQQIRPDGKVSFESLGEFTATGKTCAQLAEEMRLKAMQLYALTEMQPIDVQVSLYGSKFIYVVGEVRQPGPILCTGRDTLFRVLAQADPQVTGWKERIQVVRPSKDGAKQAKVFEINYQRMIRNGDFRKDVLLQEGDIVYVPPTILASIAMVIEEFMRPIGRALVPAVSVSRMGN